MIGRSTEGMSAVEFALFAPVLIFGLLATVDLGLALYQRMAIDSVLRAGLQEATVNSGAEKVLAVLDETASRNFDENSGMKPAPQMTVDRYHACPATPDLKVDSTTVCSGDVPTSVYYRLRGEKSYSGLFLPVELGGLKLGSFTLTSSAKVQIR